MTKHHSIGFIALALASTGMASIALPGSATAQGLPVPTVDYPGTFAPGSQTLTQERGLNLPVPPVVNVAAVNVQEAIDQAAQLNQRWSTRCVGTAPWVANGARVTLSDAAASNPFFFCRFGMPHNAEGVSANTVYSSFSEHRITTIMVASLIDNSIGSPGTVELRGVGASPGLAAVQAANLAAARSTLLLNARTRDRRRYALGTAVQTGGGAQIITDRTLGQTLTGTDTLIALFEQIGPTTAIIGTRTNCPTANSTIGCSGGVTIDIPSNTSTTNVHVFTTLYITTSVERTISGGTTFYDAALTPLPVGAVHAAAQSAGFDGANHFLGRLGRADLGVSDDRRAHVWGEAWVGRTRFDANGDAGRTSADGHGFLLGAAFAVSDSVTLGIAGEWGRTTLDVANALTPESARTDHLSGGVHARLALGGFSANAAAMIGTVDVDSAGASSQGTATGRYDATIKGASAEAGYDLNAGAVTLRPHIGFALLDWQRGAFTEVGGPAPLTVARASGQQSRLMAGLSARGSAGALTLAAYARAVRVGGDRVAAVTTFDPQLPGVPFTVIGPDHGRTLGEYGAEASIALGANARAALGYDGRSSGGLTTHAGRVTVRVGF